MSLRRVIWTVHAVLFIMFIVAAGAALWSLWTSDTVEGLIVGATVAAFAATMSAFVERLFPRDGP